MRRRGTRLRPGELVVLGVGLTAVAVAGLTWADNGPWPDAPVRALAAGPGGLGGGGLADVKARPEATAVDDAAVPLTGTQDAQDERTARTAVDGEVAAAAPVADAAATRGKDGTSLPLTAPEIPDLPGGASGAVGAASGATARAASAARAVTGTTGRMCLLVAPGAAFGAGHNGWAVRLSDGRWLEGATENNTPNELLSWFDDANVDGSFSVEPGGDTTSWTRTVGSFAQVRADFRGRLEAGGVLLHEAGYYTTMRCGDVPDAHPAAARAKAREVTASGYWVGDDNCLTKAVAVLEAYGADLPDASWEDPNDYVARSLPPLGPTRAI